uniref:HMA domain-containing protein n=1 Tax=Fagus sylvatica TaxID=28930 RepID=A0A2N9F076_FAGSY
MKQKVVIRVTSNGKKNVRSKAMQIAVGVQGVESVAIEGEENSQIVVVGDNIDSVNLTYLLRKKVGFAELASVSPISGSGSEEPKQSDYGIQAMVWQTYQPSVPYYYAYPDNHHDSCIIM